MSENIWSGGGTVSFAKFATTAKGTLYLRCQLNVYDSWKKSYMNVPLVCFDDYVCQELQKHLKDKDYVRVIGVLDITKDKEKNQTYVQVLTQKIFYYGKSKFEDIPKLNYASNSDKNAYSRATDSEIVDAAQEEAGDVPF